MKKENKWSVAEVFNKKGQMLVKKTYEKEASINDIKKIMKSTNEEYVSYEIRTYKGDRKQVSIATGSIKIF